MEYFEKAHTLKSSSLFQRDQNRKKHYKEMLYGYNHNNTDIIKSSDRFINEYEESDPSTLVFNQTDSYASDLNQSKNDNELIESDNEESSSSISKYQLNDSISALKLVSTKNSSNKTTKIKSKISKKPRPNNPKAQSETKAHIALAALAKKTAIEHTNVSSGESRSSSPLFVSVTHKTNKNTMNDIFGDHSVVNTHPLPRVDRDIFMSKSRLNLKQVQCIEPNDSDINPMTYIDESMGSEKSKPMLKDQFNDSSLVDTCEDSYYASQNSPSNDTIISFPYKVYKVRDGCIVILRHPTEVYLHGKVKVRSLGGTAEIFGYRLTDNCEVYAPSSSYAQILKTVEADNNYYGLFGKLTSLGLSVADSEEVVTTVGDFGSVLYFQQLLSKKIDYINRNFKNYDLFHKSNAAAQNIAGCTVYSEIPSKCFYENPIWTDCMERNPVNLDNPIRGIVCGGKGTGKSTFLKYFTNRQLAYGPVLVIDLDPGQCEFTVAGNISATVVKDPMVGPNYTHLANPARMLHIGMISVMDNLKRYLTAVSKLLAYCKENDAFRDLPWIVNTMGMTNGIGLKLMVYVIMSFKPTFVLQLDSEATKKGFGCYLDSKTVDSLYAEFQKDRLFGNIRRENLDYNFLVSQQHVDPVELRSSLAPKDARYLNFLAYFGELLELTDSTSLLAVTPYIVPLNSLQIGSNVKIPEHLVYKVINGKTIALCQWAPLHCTSQVFTLDNDPLVCLGYGLVRGVDTENGLLYVLTPIDKRRLSQVTCAVYADWTPDIPNDGILAQGTLLPYHTEPLYDQPELMQAPRRRFNPLQLLRLTKTS